MGFKYLICFILFFLCLVFPMEPIFRIPKYLIMIILTLYCRNLSFFKKKNFFYFIILIIIFSLYGFINSTGDLKNNIEVYLIMPFFYSWLVLFHDSKIQSYFISNVLISVIVTVSLMFLFQYLDLNHFQVNSIAGTTVRYSFNSETKEFSFPLFNVLPFTLSFIIVFFGKDKKFKITLFLLALLISYFTGRKGVFLGVSLTGILILFENLNFIFKSIIFLILFSFGVFFVINTFSVTELDYHRYFQLKSLFDMWQQNILFGHGLGAHTDLIRNIQKPSSYELFYLSLLNQIGLIGLLALTIYFKKFVLFKTKDLFIKSIQYGIISVLISSITNPYFDRFDFLFLIFIPLLLNNEKK